MSRPVPDKLEADLSALLDGELDPQRAAEVRRLADEAPDVRRRLEALRDVSDGLAALPRRRAPDSLSNVIAGLAQRRLLFGDSRPARRARLWRLVPQVGAAAAVLLACVYVGWQVLQPAPGAEGERMLDAVVEPAAPARVEQDRMARAAKPGDESELEGVLGGRGGFARADVQESGDGVADSSHALALLDPAESADEDLADEVGGAAGPLGALSGEITADAELARAEGPRTEPDGTARKASHGQTPFAHDRAAPSVDVTIRPADAAEYYAAVEIVREWAEEPGASSRAAGDASPMHGPPAECAPLHVALGAVHPVEEAAVDRTLTVPAAELRGRIAALGLSVRDPACVRVQMNLDARTIDVLAETAAPPPPPPIRHFASRAPAGGFLGCWTDDSTAAAPAEATAGADGIARGESSVARPEAAAARQPARAGRPASAPAVRDADESTPADGDAAAGARARGTPEHRGRSAADEWLDDPSAPRSRRARQPSLTPDDDAVKRRLARRQREATEIIIITVPETQPTTPPAAAEPSATAPGTEAQASSRPASGTGPPATAPTVMAEAPATPPESARMKVDGADAPTIHDLTRHLLDSLLAGVRPAESFGLAPAAPAKPEGTSVRFRVRVLPPPAGKAGAATDSGAAAAAEPPGE